MRRIVLLLLGALCTITMFAQGSITEFMGVPIDGSTKEFLAKLKTKGFTTEEDSSEVLFGKFNGEDVILTMDANCGKVYRLLMVEKKAYDEEGAKARYNELLSQFVDGTKYVFINGSYFIEEETDISYEMTINNATFESYLIFAPTPMEEEEVENKLASYMSSKYSDEELQNPTEEMIKDNNLYYLSLIQEQDVKLKKRLVRLSISTKGDTYRIAIAFVNGNNADGDVEI